MIKEDEMRKKRKQDRFAFIFTAVLIAACLLGLQESAIAYDVNIHGYGDQNFIDTNQNEYLGASEGSWEKRSMSLIVDAEVLDDTTIWTKIFFDDEEFAVEWLYAELNLGYDMHARAGQMKFPIGLENLIRDNKFLHLGALDPQMYSDSVEFIHETFMGVDLEYNGPVTLEIFYGAPEAEEEEGLEFELKNLIGGRLLYKTPLEGLSVMLSASDYKEEIFDSGTGAVVSEEGHESVWVASLKYDYHDLDFQAEYGRKNGVDEDMESYYAQLGYAFSEKVTPYARYDYIATDLDEKDEKYAHQRDITVGISYKINNNVKLKVEEHVIRGYGLPVETGEIDPASGEAEDDWTMFVAAVNFIF